MSKPLNHGGKTAEEVVRMVEGYLKTPVKTSDDGWAPVTHDDIHQLHKVINALIDAKFERDVDGDHTVEYAVCNRRYGYMHVIQSPYHAETDEDKRKMLRAIGTAASLTEHLTRSLEFEVTEKIDAKKRQEKMSPVVEFLRATDCEDACLRVEQYITGNGELFVGTRDEVWKTLGLTCAEIKQVKKDNHGQRYRNAVDDLLLNAAKTMGA